MTASNHLSRDLKNQLFFECDFVIFQKNSHQAEVHILAAKIFIEQKYVVFIGMIAGRYPVENNARFNGSTYVGMIIDNIENKLLSSIPYWKFLKVKTMPCSFSELSKQLGPLLYDNSKLNCVFPYDCKSLPVSGDFAVIILATDTDQLRHLENELKKMGIKR